MRPKISSTLVFFGILLLFALMTLLRWEMPWNNNIPRLITATPTHPLVAQPVESLPHNNTVSPDQEQRQVEFTLANYLGAATSEARQIQELRLAIYTIDRLDQEHKPCYRQHTNLIAQHIRRKLNFGPQRHLTPLENGLLDYMLAKPRLSSQLRELASTGQELKIGSANYSAVLNQVRNNRCTAEYNQHLLKLVNRALPNYDFTGRVVAVLDGGPGLLGSELVPAVKYTGSVISIDVHPEFASFGRHMQKYLPAYKHLEFRTLAKPTSSGLTAGEADVVLALSGQLANLGAPASFNQWSKAMGCALKPGGFLVIAVPLAPPERVNKVAELLEKQGLIVEPKQSGRLPASPGSPASYLVVTQKQPKRG